jgi:hypothetical protein
VGPRGNAIGCSCPRRPAPVAAGKTAHHAAQDVYQLGHEPGGRWSLVHAYQHIHSLRARDVHDHLSHNLASAVWPGRAAHIDCVVLPRAEGADVPHAFAVQDQDETVGDSLSSKRVRPALIELHGLVVVDRPGV